MKTYYYESTVPMHPGENGTAPAGILTNYIKAVVEDDAVCVVQVEQGLIYECYVLAHGNDMVIDGVINLRALTEVEFVQHMRMADAMTGPTAMQ